MTAPIQFAPLDLRGARHIARETLTHETEHGEYRVLIAACGLSGAEWFFTTNVGSRRKCLRCFYKPPEWPS